MSLHRRDWARLAGLGRIAGIAREGVRPGGTGPLAIRGLKVTPIASPDPPLLAASGCHGPCFLLAASIPQHTLASDTHYPRLPDDADIIEGPKLPVRDGRMDIPPGPGPGVTLDRDGLARAAETCR